MNEKPEDRIFIEYEEESRINAPSRLVRLFALFIATFLCGTFLFYLYLTHQNVPADPFPTNTPIVVDEGSTLPTISRTLFEHGVIRAPFLFSFLATFSGSAEHLHAGTYYFPQPLTTRGVLDALASGKYSNNTIVLTIREGARVTNIASTTLSMIPDFDRVRFVEIATPFEGYLFPDTYHIPPTITPDELLTLLRETFDEKVTAELQLSPSELTRDTVILASILEREGNSSENMGLISGILHNRLEQGMPLQVDATLEYERGKGSSDLSVDDLKDDSTYNTYTRKGLPPTPIANPGIVALRAALEPTSTDYFYYLTGNDGEFYYAKTFEEHKRNKARYLSR